jgi:hypothetical protein
MYRCRPGSVALAMVISWAGFVGFVLSFYFWAHVLWDGKADNPLPTLTQHFLLVPVGLIIMAMPLFPGGAGIGEAGFGALYGWFRCEPAGGVLGTLVWRVNTWVLGLFGYLVYLQMRSGLQPAAAPAPAGSEDGAPQAAGANGVAGKHPLPEAVTPHDNFAAP